MMELMLMMSGVGVKVARKRHGKAVVTCDGRAARQCLCGNAYEEGEDAASG
jgi:hypothetical protein